MCDRDGHLVHRIKQEVKVDQDFPTLLDDSLHRIHTGNIDSSTASRAFNSSPVESMSADSCLNGHKSFFSAPSQSQTMFPQAKFGSSMDLDMPSQSGIDQRGNDVRMIGDENGVYSSSSQPYVCRSDEHRLPNADLGKADLWAGRLADERHACGAATQQDLSELDALGLLPPRDPPFLKGEPVEMDVGGQIGKPVVPCVSSSAVMDPARCGEKTLDGISWGTSDGRPTAVPAIHQSYNGLPVFPTSVHSLMHT